MEDFIISTILLSESWSSMFSVEILNYKALKGLGCTELLYNLDTKIAPEISGIVVFRCLSLFPWKDLYLPEVLLCKNRPRNDKFSWILSGHRLSLFFINTRKYTHHQVMWDFISAEMWGTKWQSLEMQSIECSNHQRSHVCYIIIEMWSLSKASGNEILSSAEVEEDLYKDTITESKLNCQIYVI